MVTGIEVAGLTLAVFPLLVEGLKSYASGCRTIGEWRKYLFILNKLVRRLRGQNVIFENTCTGLFEELFTAEQVTDLMKSPGGEGWKSVEFSRVLHERLLSAETFLETVDEMRKSIQELHDLFELSPANKASSLDPEY